MTCARCDSTGAIGVRFPGGVAEPEPCPDCAGTGSYCRTTIYRCPLCRDAGCESCVQDHEPPPGPRPWRR